MNMHNIMLGDLFYNENCIEGAREHIKDGAVDLIITDPPYGINADTFEKHYNRKESNVIAGYVEIPKEKYEEFSNNWIREAERILRPGGSIYIISGYTNLYYVLAALRNTSLKMINHIIWKFNFGVHTTRKYVSSHYHILYLVKPGGKVTFNTYCRFGENERDEEGGSLNYQDREDVWAINKEYKPNRKKNRNELPTSLLIKMMQYSSNEGDLVCDLFLGGFSTAKVAIGLRRKVTGFEISQSIFRNGIAALENVKPGYLLEKTRTPDKSNFYNRGKPWTEEEKLKVKLRYKKLRNSGRNKKDCITVLSSEFGRGRFSISKVLETEVESSTPQRQLLLEDS
jgi:site-specific DNA-methyltransferase (adenine-specific)